MNSDERAPVTPQPVDIPWQPVPSSVNVDVSDADAARALWDYHMSDYAGMLDAAVD